jgi:hypothetical protein
MDLSRWRVEKPTIAVSLSNGGPGVSARTSIGYDQLCAEPRDTGVEVSLRNASGKNGSTCMRRAQPIAETGVTNCGETREIWQRLSSQQRPLSHQ